MEWISLGCRHALLIQQGNLAVQSPWLCIIFNSALNLDLSDWYELFQKKPLVDALLDRLQHRCIILRVSGPSLRSEPGGAPTIATAESTPESTPESTAAAKCSAPRKTAPADESAAS